MKWLVFPSAISFILTLCCSVGGIFFIGLDFLLLPLLLILFFISLTGIITIPVAIYRIIRKKNLGWVLSLYLGITIGFYIGIIFSGPLTAWDDNQRNKSGVILSKELEDYRANHGVYPDSLSQLNPKVAESLPVNYKLGRFNYRSQKEAYRLYIVIPVFDSYEWNKKKQIFEYSDF